MKQSNVSGHWTADHWTDEQLIAGLYGVGPSDGHLETCAECRERSQSLMAGRTARERVAPEEVTFDFLAAQRRSIYARLTKPVPIGFRRFASVAALAVIGAGVFTYQEEHRPAVNRNIAVDSRISDAQLAAEVSEMGQDSDPAPVAPIQALFE